MTESEFDGIMDRLAGHYPKWARTGATPTQRAYFSGKILPLHENDVIGAIDEYVTKAKTTYQPNLGEIVVIAWARRQSRTGETHSEKREETPIEAMRRLYKKPASMSDHEVVCRVAAGDIRAHEARTAELDQPARWAWIYRAMHRHFAVDESVYWADRWCGSCPDGEAAARAKAAKQADEYARYERGELTLLDMVQAAMPAPERMSRAVLIANRRREIRNLVAGATA